MDKLEWPDTCYVEFGLARPSLEETEGYLHPEICEW